MDDLYDKLKTIKFSDERSKLQKLKDYLKITIAVLIAIPVAIVTILFLIYMFAIINDITFLKDKFKGIHLAFDSIIVIAFFIVIIGFLITLIGLFLDWLIKKCCASDEMVHS